MPKLLLASTIITFKKQSSRSKNSQFLLRKWRNASLMYLQHRCLGSSPSKMVLLLDIPARRNGKIDPPIVFLLRRRSIWPRILWVKGSAQTYQALLTQLKDLGLHIAIGGVALPNAASIALHEKLGFRKVAHFSDVGFKFSKWIDVAYWQLPL